MPISGQGNGTTWSQPGYVEPDRTTGPNIYTDSNPGPDIDQTGKRYLVFKDRRERDGVRLREPGKRPRR